MTPRFEFACFDLDDTLGQTELVAGREGALRTMIEFQHVVLKANHAPKTLYCWKTGEVVTYDEFLSTTPGSAMLDMLRGVARKRNIEVADEVIFQWDAKEDINITNHFDCAGVAAVPGAIDMVRELSEMIPKRAVVSSSKLRRQYVCLSKLGLLDYFHGFFSAQGRGKYINGHGPDQPELWVPPDSRFHSVEDHKGKPFPKPSPSVYELACWKMQVDASRVLTIEDSPSGVMSASGVRRGETEHTGICGLGLIIGFANVPDHLKVARKDLLMQAGAHVVVDHLDEVVPLVREYMGSPVLV